MNGVRVLVAAVLIALVAAGCPKGSGRSREREGRRESRQPAAKDLQGSPRVPMPAKGEPIKLTPLSGREGYAVEGPFGLTGTLTRDDYEQPEWHLSGKFVFPTGGYHVAVPIEAVSDSQPQKVYITFPIAPQPGAAITQSSVEVPVDLKIRAEADAQFILRVVHVPLSR